MMKLNRLIVAAAICFSIRMSSAEDLQISVRTLEPAELLTFESGPFFPKRVAGVTRRFSTEHSFILGDSNHIVTVLTRTVQTYRQVKDFEDVDPDTGLPRTRVVSDIEPQVGERILVIDAKLASAKQLELIGEDAKNFHFVGAFQGSGETLEILVNLRKSEREYQDAMLWEWNPTTGEVKRTDERSRLWMLRRAVDNTTCFINESKFDPPELHSSDLVESDADESDVDESEVTIHNRKSGRSARMIIDNRLADCLPESIKRNDPIDFFIPTISPTSVIVVRDGKPQIECIDTESDDGVRWTLSKNDIAKKIGSSPYSIFEITTTSPRSSSVHVIVNDDPGGESYYVQIDVNSGIIVNVVKLKLKYQSISTYCVRPAISEDGRYLAAVNTIDVTHEGIRIFDLVSGGTYVDMPFTRDLQVYWGNLQIIGIIDNRSLILECGSAFWQVDTETARKRKQVFGLPRIETDEMVFGLPKIRD